MVCNYLTGQKYKKVETSAQINEKIAFLARILLDYVSQKPVFHKKYGKTKNY